MECLDGMHYLYMFDINHQKYYRIFIAGCSLSHKLFFILFKACLETVAEIIYGHYYNNTASNIKVPYRLKTPSELYQKR